MCHATLQDSPTGPPNPWEPGEQRAGGEQEVRGAEGRRHKPPTAHPGGAGQPQAEWEKRGLSEEKREAPSLA